MLHLLHRLEGLLLYGDPLLDRRLLLHVLTGWLCDRLVLNGLLLHHLSGRALLLEFNGNIVHGHNLRLLLLLLLLLVGAGKVHCAILAANHDRGRLLRLSGRWLLLWLLRLRRLLHWLGSTGLVDGLHDGVHGLWACGMPVGVRNILNLLHLLLRTGSWE